MSETSVMEITLQLSAATYCWRSALAPKPRDNRFRSSEGNLNATCSYKATLTTDMSSCHVIFD